MYKGKKVSVVMPAYNEEAIVQVIDDFNKEFVDEIVVVDNNSTDGTGERARKAGARVVREKRQGQGYACIRALKEASGDLIFITESDATFVGEDMEKLLQHIENADMVLGSRVSKSFSTPESITWYTRWGNLFLSFLLQKLYGNKTSLNDVGVTFRLFKRKALYKFIDKMHVGGPDWCVEPTILALKHNLRVVQIPTWYMPRRGKTKQSFGIISSAKIGLKHLFHILRMRVSD